MSVEVGIHWSLLPVAVLVSWLLATRVLPLEVPGAPGPRYWVVGVALTVAYLGSLLAHELSHAVVARRRGIAVRGIVLWLLGGMAQIEGEPTTARDELMVAAVGPASSLGLAGGFGLAYVLAERLGSPPLLAISLLWLAWVNLLLGVFNLLPAFPLDGGRLLKALLWRLCGRRRAIHLAARVGQVLGSGAVVVGLWLWLFELNLEGLWLVLVGVFIAMAAGSQISMSQAQQGLVGLRVRDAMTPEPYFGPSEATVEEVIERWARMSWFSTLPLVDPAWLPVGLVTMDRLRTVPPGRWACTPALAIACPMGELVVCGPDDDLAEVAQRMQASRDRRALVLQAGSLVGILAPSDLAHARHRADLMGGGGPLRDPRSGSWWESAAAPAGDPRPMAGQSR